MEEIKNEHDAREALAAGSVSGNKQEWRGLVEGLGIADPAIADAQGEEGAPVAPVAKVTYEYGAPPDLPSIGSADSPAWKNRTTPEGGGYPTINP